MKRNMRKLTYVLILLASMAWTGKISAQTFKYPDYPDHDKIAVKYQGSRPTINDFATAYLDYISGEEDFYIEVYEAWKKFQQNKPLGDNVSFMTDVRNGYMRYEKINVEENDTIIWEMCFWNCADGKQKLVCSNAIWILNGDYGATAGTEFLVYDNAKKRMRFIYPDDIGALYDGDGLSVFFLPRKGKDIRVSAAGSGERWDEVLEWDGYQFSSKVVP